MKLVIAFCIVMAPGVAFAQHRSADTGSGGAAVPSGASAGSSSSSGGSSTSSSSGSTSQSSDGNFASVTAGHRTGSVTFPTNPAAANSTSGTFTNYSNLTFPAPEFARPRSSLPANMAFPKGSVPTLTLTPTNGNLSFIVGAYNPWLYAYDGLYAMPFYGAFDPFAVDFGYAGPLVGTTTTPAKDEKGVLHLNVKPRDAEVYIDGGLVGKASQFEGVFHKLRLEAGVHRVELRAPGYAPLVVNVRIQPGESMTYRGTLEKIAP